MTPAGGKSWRMKYRFPATRQGKEKSLTFGLYPKVSLADARDACELAKKQIKDRIDPAVQRKRDKILADFSADRTFKKVASAWYEINRCRWSKTHAANVIDSLEADIFPVIGDIPIAQIDVILVLSALQAIERRGAFETAHRVRQRMEAVFAYALGLGFATTNPAVMVTGALRPVPRSTKYPALTQVDDFRAMLRAVEAAHASPVTKLAHRLLALTALRPGVLVSTPWEPDEFVDLESPRPLWHISAQRMKLSVENKNDQDFDFLVPLAPQAVDIIHAIRTLTGGAKFMFPNERSILKPMSENCLNAILKRLGYHNRHVPHGDRSSSRRS